MTHFSRLILTTTLAITATTTAYADDGYFSDQRGCFSNQGEWGYSHVIRRRCGYSNFDIYPSDGCRMRSRTQYDNDYDYQYPHSFGRQPDFSDRSAPLRIPSIQHEVPRHSPRPLADQYPEPARQICPVTKKPLGSMGQPVPVRIGNRSVFVCCAGCVDTLKSNPQKYLGTEFSQQFHDGHSLEGDVDKASPFLPDRQPAPRATRQIPAEMEGVSLLPIDQQAAALKQRTCPVTKQPLGSMGKPIYVTTPAGSLFVCCEGCVETFKQSPQQYLVLPDPSKQD